MHRRIAPSAFAVLLTALVAAPDGVVAQAVALDGQDAITSGEPEWNDRTRPAELLFRSGFEGEVEIGALRPYGDGAWQEITGEDTESGFAWPPSIWGGNGAFQLIAGDEATIVQADLAARMTNELEFVAGPHGNRTRALRQIVRGGTGGADENWSSTQNDLVLMPGPEDQGDLYIAYWLKLEDDVYERLTADPWDRGARRLIPALLPQRLEHSMDSPWAARVLTDWKTGRGTEGGDYRILLSIYGDRDAHRLYWNLRGDSVANGGMPEQVFWEQTNTIVRVPVGRWFRLEIFVHRSHGEDGRVWVAVDGATLFDRHGPNFGIHGLPWNRIMPFLNYSTGQRLPAEQWVDDLEIRYALPPSAAAAAVQPGDRP